MTARFDGVGMGWNYDKCSWGWLSQRPLVYVPSGSPRVGSFRLRKVLKSSNRATILSIWPFRRSDRRDVCMQPLRLLRRQKSSNPAFLAVWPFQQNSAQRTADGPLIASSNTLCAYSALSPIFGNRHIKQRVDDDARNRRPGPPENNPETRSAEPENIRDI